jgi:hypothetical protein
MKLTSGLQRSLIDALSPAAASVRTSYGATAAPPSLSTLHLEAYQAFRQTQHALEKIEKVVFRGVLTRGGAPKAEVRFPIWTEAFSKMLDTQRMKSAALYNADELANLVSGRPASGTGAARVLVVATIEELCRELDYEIGADFFDALYA